MSANMSPRSGSAQGNRPGGNGGSFSARAGTPRGKFNPTRTFGWEGSGANYLRDSKINSATGFISVGGGTFAIPYGRRSTTPTGGQKRTGATEYSDKFVQREHCFASMARKPLSPYDMLAQRSRLAIEDPPVPYKNLSNIQMDSGLHVCHKRRFVTTYQNFFEGEALDPRTNSGVISETAKLRHALQSS